MSDLLHGGTALLIYFAIAASTALVSRALITIPDELFRKILHFILLGSLLVFVFAFDVWWISALSSLAFAIVVYPLMKLFYGLDVQHWYYYIPFYTPSAVMGAAMGVATLLILKRSGVLNHMKDMLER